MLQISKTQANSETCSTTTHTEHKEAATEQSNWFTTQKNTDTNKLMSRPTHARWCYWCYIIYMILILLKILAAPSSSFLLITGMFISLQRRLKTFGVLFDLLHFSIFMLPYWIVIFVSLFACVLFSCSINAEYVLWRLFLHLLVFLPICGFLQ